MGQVRQGLLRVAVGRLAGRRCGRCGRGQRPLPVQHSRVGRSASAESMFVKAVT